MCMCVCPRVVLQLRTNRILFAHFSLWSWSSFRQSDGVCTAVAAMKRCVLLCFHAPSLVLFSWQA